MRRESHVRFCEGGGVQFPSATRLMEGSTKTTKENDSRGDRLVPAAKPGNRQDARNQADDRIQKMTAGRTSAVRSGAY